jgi:hypothetical protein
MKAFRNVWNSALGGEPEHVVEIPTVANGGVPINLNVSKDTVEFDNRVVILGDFLREMLIEAKSRKWIGPP